MSPEKLTRCLVVKIPARGHGVDSTDTSQMSNGCGAEMTVMLRQIKRQTFSRVEGRERKNEMSTSRFLLLKTSCIASPAISSSTFEPPTWPLQSATKEGEHVRRRRGGGVDVRRRRGGGVDVRRRRESEVGSTHVDL